MTAANFLDIFEINDKKLGILTDNTNVRTASPVEMDLLTSLQFRQRIRDTVSSITVRNVFKALKTNAQKKAGDLRKAEAEIQRQVMIESDRRRAGEHKDREGAERDRKASEKGTTRCRAIG